MESRSEGAVDRPAGRCLLEAVAGLTGSALERRHESLMEWAVAELELPREYAEQVYALAEEEQLTPIWGFLLVRCGVGVRELESPTPDAEGSAAQQAPPQWLGADAVELDDVTLERRLRATFRRLRSHLESGGDAASAVRSFLAEPDVAPLRLR